MFARIKPIFKKELRQIMRDRLTLALLTVIPVFMLIMFGYALSFDVKNISLGVYDEDKSTTSREFITKFTNSGYFNLNYYAASSNDIDEEIQKGTITAGIIIPRTFSNDIRKGETAAIQIIIDGSNSNSASTSIGYVNSIISDYSSKMLVREIRKKTNSDTGTAIDYRPRVWYNPELISSKFLIPALIGFILMVVSVILTSLSIVREKEKNTIEQIIVSPIKPHELILGKILTNIILALLISVFIIIAAYFLFGLEIKGNILLLFISILIFLSCSLGLGIMISTVAETQQVAFMISVIITMLPSFILSGFVFPIRNMPVVIQLVTYVVPARYFLVILRNIIIKGTGIESYWQEMAALIILSAVLLGISIKRLSKKTF